MHWTVMLVKGMVMENGEDWSMVIDCPFSSLALASDVKRVNMVSLISKLLEEV